MQRPFNCILRPRKVAEGWSSIVYEVPWEASSRTHRAILKRLRRCVIDQDPVLSRPHLVEAMEREATALAGIRHDSIPKLIARTSLGEDPCLLLEWKPGRCLSQFMESHGPLAWPLVKQIALQLLDILSTIHAKGWIHCDLNPGNVLLGQQLFLVDFGACQRIGRPLQWDWPLGRHRYMGPEHLLGRYEKPRYQQLGPASDLHQVACLLIYLLLGKEPFRPPFPEEVYATQYLLKLGIWMDYSVEKKMKSLSVEAVRKDVPKGLDHVLARGLEPNPTRRYSSAGAMSAALKTLP